MTNTNWTKATRHLRRDPVLAKLIARVGPCRLKSQRNHFVLLCRAIYSQQISSIVARVLFNRFCDRFPRRQPTPKAVLRLLKSKTADLKSCGLSRQKREYLIDLSRHFLDNRIPAHRLSRMTDEQIIESLTAVRGIGRWTAEMFLMFVLNRTDVLPVDDLGLRASMQRIFRLRQRPTPKRMKKIAEPWRPYRSVASWYLWRASDDAEWQ
jgi:3-methyladenine DNA glycosylase/8-oxoguanine DNA glycosylase